MALSLDEVKELLSFGRDLGLQQLQVADVACVYGTRILSPEIATENSDETAPDLDDLRRYSAIGRKAMMKGESK
jgi:hypothetical protein